MRVFVTGATGVIGRRVVPSLIEQGHRVTAAGRRSPRLDALARHGATAVVLDIFDAAASRKAIEGHDVVINLATPVPSNNRMFLSGAWKEMDRVRRDASRVLADAAIQARVQRFIQESFAPIYPDCGDVWITERTPPRPARYNRTVLDAEASAERVGHDGAAAVVLRFALLYGAGDQFTESVFKTVRAGWMPFLGRRDGYVSLITHEDAARAVVAALGVAPGIYNVVDNEPLRRDALAIALADLLGVKPPRHLPPWLATLGGSLGETIARSLRVSNEKLRQASGWSPTYPSARDGFRAALTASGNARPSPQAAPGDGRSAA